MSAITHRDLETNGIRMHVAEQGTGPLIVLCHGFPESWYSWRHQLAALSAAGFHAVAPDMRGYGRTDFFRAVIGLSVPYRPRGPVRPTTAMPQTDDTVFYQLYFQTPGVAEVELEQDVRATIRRL